ncbi:MAG: hypothetical protein AAGA23_12000 [Pseudomonadota bacterium]
MLKIIFFTLVGATYDPLPKAYVCGYFGSGCKCEARGPIPASNPAPIEVPGPASRELKRLIPSFDYTLYVEEMGSVVAEVFNSLRWNGVIEVTWKFGPSERPEFTLANSPGLSAESIRAITDKLRALPGFRTAGGEVAGLARFEICGYNTNPQLAAYRGG